jgi:3-oxoadipate enol-lactonase
MTVENLFHTRDGVLNYKLEGVTSGLTIVFIHGFPLTLDSWDAQVEALKSDFRILRYDISGLGKSVHNDCIFTIDSHADDLIRLMDECKIESAVICGLSLGGYIALRAYEKSPGRFSGIILSNTRSAADDNGAKIKRAEQVKSLKENGIEPFASAFSKAILSEPFRSTTANFEKVHNTISKQSIKGLTGNLVAMAARTDTTERLENINVPALVIYSDMDSVIKQTESEQLQQKIKNARLENIPGAGHLSNLEKPHQFNEVISDFLKSIR